MALGRRAKAATLFLLGLALLACRAAGTRPVKVELGLGPLPLPDGLQIFDVTNFNAFKDNIKKDSASAIIRAWSAACKSNANAAKVVIPPGNFMAGEMIFRGPCNCKSLTLEVQGNVVAETDLSAYANGAWFNFEDIQGVLVTGAGTLDGRGQEAWQHDNCPPKTECESPLPPTILFNRVTNSGIERLTLLNSKGYNIQLVDSHFIKVSHVTTLAPDNSPNTEGIHVVNTANVEVANSKIQSGTRCIGLGPGAVNFISSNIQCVEH